MYLLHIPTSSLDEYGFRCPAPTHPELEASDAVRVPQVRALPGPYLPTGPSGFLQIPHHWRHPCLRLAVPSVRARRGLLAFFPCLANHLLETKHAGHTSGRRGVYTPRPPTPPDIRVRIRRFMKYNLVSDAMWLIAPTLALRSIHLSWLFPASSKVAMLLDC